MSRNAMNVFNQVPSIDINRSRFDRSHKACFTCNAGILVPFMVEPVLPGDTWEIKTQKFIRAQTLLHPLMDDLYADFYYFYCSNIILWDHWKEFCGEANPNAWIQNPSYTIPKVNIVCQAGQLNSVADYMGIPSCMPDLNGKTIAVNALPFRAYCSIWNEFFRDENLQNPVNVNFGDSTVGLNSMFPTVGAVYNAPLPVNKYRDYFTSSLPGVQKGPIVPVLPSRYIPVVANTTAAGSFTYDVTDPMKVSVNGTHKDLYDSSATVKTGTSTEANAIHPVNLVADLWLGAASGSEIWNVNDLRMAFAVQRFYEALARGGSRYTEILQNLFHVHSPDSKLYRPEYLGGNRVHLNINSVVNQAESANSPLGELGAYSVTSDKHHDFIFSAQQHGWIIGVMCIRYDHTYSQGAERFWFDSDRFDLYWPQMANLGEQPILNGEIFMNGTTSDKEAFGFQEAWASYRWKPNAVRGEMRPGVSRTLASWNLADYYTSRPYLSAAWMQEDIAPIDRALAVNSSQANQFLVDMKIMARVIRPMPLYSVPGLIDHH